MTVLLFRVGVERVFIRKPKGKVKRLQLDKPTAAEMKRYQKRRLIIRLRKGYCYTIKEIRSEFDLSRHIIDGLLRDGWPIEGRQRDCQSIEKEYYWRGYTDQDRETAVKDKLRFSTYFFMR